MTDPINWTEQRKRLGDLTPWPRNPRQIKSPQAKRLLQSVQEFGQVETLAIGPDGDIYNGHQRLAVLMERYGPDYEVDVRVSSRPLSEKEREKLTVYLHKGAAGEWDFDILANEFEVSELIEWGFDAFELGLGGDTDEGYEDSPFSEFDDIPTDENYVPFKFGDYSGRVSRIIYDAFVKEYQTQQERSGEPMLDDVLRGWLGV